MKKYVLVINCGSSSLKFAVIDPETAEQPLKGKAEKLNQESGELHYFFAGKKHSEKIEPNGHGNALSLVVDLLVKRELTDSICAIGHRVVHGGEYFAKSVLINDEVRSKIDKCCRLAPLHNPAHIAGINAAEEVFPSLPQVAVFDTAFHHNLPEKAYLYALPRRFYEEFHIRKYGFHGTSYRFITQQLEKLTGKKDLKTIVCHLGNGSSVAAIDGDHSLDTTMGLTPLDGLVSGTRCGSIDPAIPRILVEQFGINVHEAGDILWEESGLLGLSQISNDCRTLEELITDGNKAAQRALDVYCYRLAQNIASQMVATGGTDLIAFTGGIGENSSYVRKRTLEQLAFLGFKVDDDLNTKMFDGEQGLISAEDSLPIWVIATNEELLIAQDTARLAAESYN